jgi:hypothetical protein
MMQLEIMAGVGGEEKMVGYCKISKDSNYQKQNIYCLIFIKYIGGVYMVQASPGVPKLAQFWRDPAFVI